MTTIRFIAFVGIILLPFFIYMFYNFKWKTTQVLSSHVRKLLNKQDGPFKLLISVHNRNFVDVSLQGQLEHYKNMHFCTIQLSLYDITHPTKTLPICGYSCNKRQEGGIQFSTKKSYLLSNVIDKLDATKGLNVFRFEKIDIVPPESGMRKVLFVVELTFRNKAQHVKHRAHIATTQIINLKYRYYQRDGLLSQLGDFGSEIDINFIKGSIR
ncbi:hypothetical protein [Flocculibacter collagenilyticus]|uniref:hypothetical protein n=1 Tax=Flocculibacter collagenilyticus TaxID=2744479 RepID=UPI0018F37639|nr:hypothetical protein [Flocculibacter collagenilyticus]